MRELSGIMGKAGTEEHLESCRARYAGRNREGKSLMIDEVSDVFGWDRKHTIKVLNGRVRLGRGSGKRGKSVIYGEAEKAVIIEIWKNSEQPCGIRLKETLPLWMASYEKHWGRLKKEVPQPRTGWKAMAERADARDGTVTVLNNGFRSDAARGMWIARGGWKPTRYPTEGEAAVGCSCRL